VFSEGYFKAPTNFSILGTKLPVGLAAHMLKVTTDFYANFFKAFFNT